MSVQDLNEKNIDGFLKNEYAVVDFWAEWCGPCRMFLPIFEEKSNTEKGIAFGRINVDENETLASNFNIFGIPTVVFFKKGKEIDRLVGAQTKERFASWLEKNKK